jgi:hypothetical protein
MTRADRVIGTIILIIVMEIALSIILSLEPDPEAAPPQTIDRAPQAELYVSS